MSAALTAWPAAATTVDARAHELTVVLTRIRARCRPDLAVTAAQRLESLLGVLEASRSELRAARSGAGIWLGLGSLAFVASVDQMDADAGRAVDAIRAGAGALRAYANVAERCLADSRGIEHRLRTASDERSRRLAAEPADGLLRPPSGSAPAAGEAFEAAVGELLVAARRVLADVDAAVAALTARLHEVSASALPPNVGYGLDPVPGAAVGSGPGIPAWLGGTWEGQGTADSVTTLWTGGKALWAFADYARSPQGAARALAQARYAAALRPLQGWSARTLLPLSIIHNVEQAVDPAHPGARGWGDRATGLAGAAGGAALLTASTGLIALGPVGAAAAVGGLVVASAWQLGNLVYDHREEIRDGLSKAWHRVEDAGETAVRTWGDVGSTALRGVEQAGGVAVDALTEAGSSAVQGVEDAGGAFMRGAAGIGRGILHGIGIG